MEELDPWVVELHLGSPLGLLSLALSAIGVFLAAWTLHKTRTAAEAAVRAVADLRDLYKLAKRQAHGVEQALDEILSALG